MPVSIDHIEARVAETADKPGEAAQPAPAPDAGEIAALIALVSARAAERMARLRAE